jgi:methylase of polypeptide subunit release factors
VEFGAGDGSPVISALLKSNKAPADMPVINAYEIGASAAQLATTHAASVGLGDMYRVHNSCFWTGAVKEGRPEDKCLIANPPYIPAAGEHSWKGQTPADIVGNHACMCIEQT